MPENKPLSASAFIKLSAKLVAGATDVLFASVAFSGANSAVVVITRGNSTVNLTLSPEAACACASLRCNRICLLNALLAVVYPSIVTFSGDTLAAVAIVVFRVSSKVVLKVVFARSERSTASNVTVPFTRACTLTATATVVGEAVGAVVGEPVVGEAVGASVAFVGEVVGASVVGEVVGAQV
jgi:hypothetical protein